MKDLSGRGKYSKVIRGLEDGIRAIESVMDRVLAERDAEIARLKQRLEVFEAAATVPTAPQVPEGMCEHDTATAEPGPAYSNGDRK